MEILNVDVINLASWLGIGLLLWYIAVRLVWDKNAGGYGTSLIASLFGAIIGGLSSVLIFGSNLVDIDLQSMASAAVGAVIVLVIARLTQRSGGHIKTTS